MVSASRRSSPPGGGRCSLSIRAAAAEAAAGEAEEARMTVAWRTTTSQMRPLGGVAAGTTCEERSRSNRSGTSSDPGRGSGGG
jgi:hypothetical protein